MAAPARRYITLEEYERLERLSETKNEWFDGEIVAMSGSSFPHVRISKNLLFHVERQLRGGPCEAFSAELRVRTRSLRAYPDLTIHCGHPSLDPESPIATIDNPVSIFEVLSPSTASFDRGAKFEQYRTLESLRDYVVAAQDRIYIEHYTRQEDGSWRLVELRDEGAILQLTGAPAELPLAEFYERVELPTGHGD